jgi:hypothetical protein
VIGFVPKNAVGSTYGVVPGWSPTRQLPAGQYGYKGKDSANLENSNFSRKNPIFYANAAEPLS